jgi:hypothetical protein
MDTSEFIDSKQKDTSPELVWSNRTEELLISWCDISKCYTWLHERSFRKYNRANYFFSIPIIILSTLSGAASVGLSGYVPGEYLNISQLSIGLVNIFTGIITTLQNFFRYAQNSESHHNASVGWSKLSRNISIELSLERDKRKRANEFVKICRAEYDRLMERSPIIPTDIIQDFKRNMKFDDMIMPDILDNLGHTVVFRGNEIENGLENGLENKTKNKTNNKMNNIQLKNNILNDIKKSIFEKKKNISKKWPPVIANVDNKIYADYKINSNKIDIDKKEIVEYKIPSVKDIINELNDKKKVIFQKKKCYLLFQRKRMR